MEREVIELYARDYARLQFERAELNSTEPSEDEALKRLRSLQRELRKRELERHVTLRLPAELRYLVLTLFGIGAWYVRLVRRGN